MCALVVVIKCDSQTKTGVPRMFIDMFLHIEIAASGNRLVIVTPEDGDVPPPLSPEMAPTFRTRALSVNFIDVELSDTRAHEFLKEITNDYDSTHEVRRGQRIESISLAGNGLTKEVAAITGNLLLHPRCRLKSLDLSYNNFPYDSWMKLVEIVGKSASLTYLDMRQHSAVADSVLQKFGEELLRPKSVAGLCCIRCDAFDVLHNVSALQLQEKVLDPGATCLLAGVLRRNTDIRHLDLTAAGVEDSGVDYLAKALQSNTTLERLCLRHNLFATPTQDALSAVLESRSQPLVVEY